MNRRKDRERYQTMRRADPDYRGDTCFCSGCLALRDEETQDAGPGGPEPPQE